MANNFELPVYRRDGTCTVIYSHQNEIESLTLDGAKHTTPGLEVLTDSQGRHVNEVSDGVFEVVTTGEILTRDAPK
ncbi:MAG: hypothetical protein AAGA92_14110 [Planctomycetota bacterium]